MPKGEAISLMYDEAVSCGIQTANHRHRMCGGVLAVPCHSKMNSVRKFESDTRTTKTSCRHIACTQGWPEPYI